MTNDHRMTICIVCTKWIIEELPLLKKTRNVVKLSKKWTFYTHLCMDEDCLYLEELWEVVDDGEEEYGDDVTMAVAHLNRRGTLVHIQRIVFEEMSSWTPLTMYKGMKTTF